MQQQPRTLEVCKELVAEADPFARALDQARDVRDGELAPVHLHRAEDRRERREGVVRDLRARGRDPCEQRGLARVREADKRCVGEQLQPQFDLALLARKPDLGEARRLPRRTGKVFVATAAGPAPGDDDARLGVREVGDEPALTVEHLRAHRHVQHRVLAVGAVRQAPAAATAATGAQLLIRTDAGQVAPTRIRNQHDVAAGAAVAAVRAALGHVLLAP